MSTPSNPGWYDDPQDDTKLRYFDGVIWSNHTTPRSTRPSAGASQTGQQQFPGQGHPPQYPGQAQAPAPQAPGTYAAPPASGAGAPPAGPPAAPGVPPVPPAAAQQGGWQPPGQQHPGQPYQGQPYQGQPYQGQPYQGQNQQFPGAPQGGWSAPAYPGMRAVASTPDGQPLAGFWQRVGAFVLDWLIQTVIAGILGSYFLVKAFADYFDQVSSMMNNVEDGAQPDFSAVMDSIDSTQLMYFSAIAIVVFAAYQYFFLTRSGQTPGKMVTGISVRLRERPGPPPSAVVLRRLALPVGLFLLQLVPLVGTIAALARLLDLVWPAWDDKNQALHDKVAMTNVVVGKQPRS